MFRKLLITIGLIVVFFSVCSLPPIIAQNNAQQSSLQGKVTVSSQSQKTTVSNAKQKANKSDMALGMEYFNRHDYRNALVHFNAASREDPNDCNALYYEAITLHKMKEISLAKQAYATVVLRYPNTQAARNAQIALNYLNPSYLKTFKQQISTAAHSMSGQTSGTNTAANSFNQPPHFNTASEINNFPDEVRIPYRRHGRNLIINAYINNHPVEMFFDSGAEQTVVCASLLEELGLRGVQGKPTGVSYGVGDAGAQNIWLVRTNIKVGQIERTNFPLAVQDDSGNTGAAYPLLGESFFRDFSYTVQPSADDSQGSILFKKKNAARAVVTNDSNAIPYRNVGKNMIVDVEVNGHKIPMYVDTGADTCCFSIRQWSNMGMSIPDDAVAGKSAGIAGTTNSKYFTVDRMRLGPIIQENVPVSVIESGDLPYPLLGNSFFGDLHMDVDNTAHVIHLRR